ncbi:hypothetical protein A2U01_0036498 [Trifolium medium]|uniref:Retrotransposon gag domain-containing protein n=1 Tax=Trifolium medium TaxID=97028 RepID=A0A392PV86_9FABA|nr:hypothetical protein [Trifolium medium]
MSGILESMECTEVEKVNLATRFFRGDACNWWEGAKAYMIASQVEMNWVNFKRLFIAHYISDNDDDALIEAWKMKKYRFDLRVDIAHDVSMQPIENFGDLVQKSYRAEAGLRDIRKEIGEFNQRMKDTGKYNSQLKPKSSPNKGKHNYSSRSPRNCPDCGLPTSSQAISRMNVQ